MTQPIVLPPLPESFLNAIPYNERPRARRLLEDWARAVVEANEPRVSAGEWKRVAEGQSELLKICAKTEALKDAEIAELQERMLVLLALQLRQLEPAPDPPAPVQGTTGR